MNRHLGIVHITPQLLTDLLGLPDGTRVIAVRELFDWFNQDGPVIELKCEHPDLPEANEGACIPVVTPHWITVTRMAPMLTSW